MCIVAYMQRAGSVIASPNVNVLMCMLGNCFAERVCVYNCVAPDCCVPPVLTQCFDFLVFFVEMRR